MVAASEDDHDILDHLLQAGADLEMKSKVNFCTLNIYRVWKRMFLLKLI